MRVYSNGAFATVPSTPPALYHPCMPADPELASLDRRVTLQEPRPDPQEGPERVGDRRDRLFLVLLGELGIGKSTVLRPEAACTRPITVRALLNGVPAPEGDTLFVDALDEYRSDGSEADKIHALARALAQAPPGRLTCR